MIGAVMRHVSAPPESLLMRNAVRPVAAEIMKHIAGEKHPPAEFLSPGNEIVKDNHNKKKNKLGEVVADKIPQPDQNRTSQFLVLVCITLLFFCNDVFKHGEEDHQWNCPQDQIRSITVDLFQIFKSYFRSAKEGRRQNFMGCDL